MAASCCRHAEAAPSQQNDVHHPHPTRFRRGEVSLNSRACIEGKSHSDFIEVNVITVLLILMTKVVM